MESTNVNVSQKEKEIQSEIILRKIEENVKRLDDVRANLQDFTEKLYPLKKPTEEYPGEKDEPEPQSFEEKLNFNLNAQAKTIMELEDLVAHLRSFI